jgi:hypothetical protein
MARPIKDPKAGVAVKISPCNARNVIQITKKTKRTFSSEVNFELEEYATRIRKLRGHKPQE